MNDESIINYLQNHPELVHKIQLNFSKKQTSSLVERKLTNLIDENICLKKSLNEHIFVSQQNVALSTKVHQFTLRMFSIKTLDDFIAYLNTDFKELFLFDALFIYPMTQLEENLLKYSKKGKIYFGSVKQFNLDQILSSNIQSVAIINLNNFLLLIASNNKSRFSPDMDQFFIGNIQQIMNIKLDEFKQKS